MGFNSVFKGLIYTSVASDFCYTGLAMVQTVVTAVGRIQSQISPFDILGGRTAVGQVFLRVLRFYPHSFHIPVSLTRRTKGQNL
jgi:hypothetical protein